MKQSTILLVDDEEMNLDILREYLESEETRVVCARDGQEAWDLLEKTPGISIILLDRMMPRMDGMEFMARLSRNPRYRDIPVIMQTAASSSKEILEGLRAGVFYYLTKPFTREVIVNIIKAALENARTHHQQTHDAHAFQEIGIEYISQCVLTFQTMEEAERVCHFAANLFPDPARVLIGLCELAYNAIEHGNLGIAFEEKNQLILAGRLKAEVRARLKNPAYRSLFATLTITRNTGGTCAVIADQGKGFAHEEFKDLDPLKVTKLNGRGIAIARLMSFDRMDYNAKGNEVSCYCAADVVPQLISESQAPAA